MRRAQKLATIRGMIKAIFTISLALTGLAAHAQTTLFPGRSPRAAWADPVNPLPANSTLLNQTQGTVPKKYQVDAANEAAAANGGGGESGFQKMLSGLFDGGAGGAGAGGGSGRSPSASSTSSIFAGNVDMRSCGSKVADKTALNTMIECGNRKLSMASNPIGALVDFDQKVMFIVNRASGTVTGCVDISTGPTIGSETCQMPVGMMITGPHHGGKYDSSGSGQGDCVGLQGTDPMTQKRAANGVVIHPAHGLAGQRKTCGCVGVKDEEFQKVSDMLYGSDASPKKSAVFIYDKNSREKCDGGERSGNGGGDFQPGVQQ